MLVHLIIWIPIYLGARAGTLPPERGCPQPQHFRKGSASRNTQAALRGRGCCGWGQPRSGAIALQAQPSVIVAETCAAPRPALRIQDKASLCGVVLGVTDGLQFVGWAAHVRVPVRSE